MQYVQRLTREKITLVEAFYKISVHYTGKENATKPRC